jgi:hypothetical protein
LSFSVTLRSELPAARPVTLPDPETPPVAAPKVAPSVSVKAETAALLLRIRFALPKLPPAWMRPRLILVEPSVPAARLYPVAV